MKLFARQKNYVPGRNGLYSESSLQRGVQQATLRSTGFGTGWLDYDNDGLLDLFVANGAVRLTEALRGKPYPFHELNQLSHNDGAGRRLREVTGVAGPIFQHADVDRVNLPVERRISENPLFL